ncbi:lysosomal acid phosphatase-like protein 3 [Leptotrombidium deliense]|uniref:acid phosphatase n=1 Tax=Leptotrombidium deliense TaxID=299467 RepID=A0A443S7A0_9ACAR|nr:lysosomal acid phosphatase-like protein 3 [Leptotrombidium deliense]
MPFWITNDVLRKLEEVSRKNHLFENNERFQTRLRAGSLFDEIVSILNGNFNENKRVFIYSTHDTIIAALLSGLRVFNGLNVPYAASVIFEVYESTVSTFYLNVTETRTNKLNLNTHLLRIPNCEEKCAFKKFIKNIDDLIDVQWQKECNSIVVKGN